MGVFDRMPILDAEICTWSAVEIDLPAAIGSHRATQGEQECVGRWLTKGAGETAVLPNKSVISTEESEK